MMRAVFDITLTVQGPLLSRASSPGTKGLDAVMARDQQQRPILAGSHLAGKLKDGWRWLGILDHWQSYLGEENDNGDYAPCRKRLFISDFTLIDAGGAGIRTRIAIDPQRKAADRGALCFAENLFAAGGSYRFEGRITCYCQDDGEVTQLYEALCRGLRAIPQLGGERTIGYGRLLDVTVEQGAQQFERHGAAPEIGDFADGLDLCIRPLSPFCLVRRRVADNLFESAVDIPGAAVAGAVAAMWRALLGGRKGAIDEHFDPDRPELGRHFDRIRFLHAFPGRSCLRRPVRAPLSLVKVKNQLFDVAGIDGPALIDGMAPSFAVDWKSSADVDAMFGWNEPSRELRVRTAIDPGTRRAADNKLFAYEMVVPNETVWFSRVRFPEDIDEQERRRAASQLAGLLAHGLGGLGKTKAEAEVDVLAAGTVPSRCDSALARRIDDCYCITLQTPAILCDPDLLDESSGRKEPTIAYLAAWQKLEVAYQAAWQELSGGSLELVRYYAAQSLAGGEYLWRRFQGGRPYRPWLLTDEGSVFILRAVHGKEEEADAWVRRWLAQGLDLPAWAVDRYGGTWRDVPYLPQLGYGECCVNLAVHEGLRPTATTPVRTLVEERRDG